IAYTVPATALNVTRLVKVPPAGESSLAAMAVKAETEDPVKTASIVSKLLPAVEIVTLPEAGAVQNHQTDAPPEFPAMAGSPFSLVAPVFEADKVTDEALRTVAFAKSSLIGRVTSGEPAWVTRNVCPATVSVPVREFVLVLAVADQLTLPQPVPPDGAHGHQPGALLAAVPTPPAP